MLIALNVSQRRNAAAELALSENHLAAVAEAAAELEALTLSLDKLPITTSLRQTSHLLSSMIVGADRVQQCIASLPYYILSLFCVSTKTQLCSHLLWSILIEAIIS